MLKINRKYSLNIEIPESVMMKEKKKGKQIPTRWAVNMKFIEREGSIASPGGKLSMNIKLADTTFCYLMSNVRLLLYKYGKCMYLIYQTISRHTWSKL